ncbi:MAG TPA: hypothetical protein VFH34_13635 [Anaerolineales bacterium]|nr:hypothetical protein [Anaerolineales bacterium]
MAKKFDGVVEAVRYKNGQIEIVRAFERRGSAFTDRVMLNRHEFLNRLKKGKKYFVGQRKEFLAGSFDVQDRPVQILKRDGKEIIATHSEANHDELEQAPFF